MGNDTGACKKGTVDTPFEWNKSRQVAAAMIAMGQETKSEIARRLGVHRKTIHHWETFREFQEKVLEMREKIILETDEQLIRGISEQVFRVRHILNAKLSKASTVEDTDTVKLLSEFRKLMETLHKIRSSNSAVPQEHLVNVNYTGRVQIEQLLGGIEDAVQKGKVEDNLLAIANQILCEKEGEMGDILGGGGQK